LAELGPEGRWRVGRAADNELVIDSPLVSGRHLLIERAEGRLWLTDLGSTNGSFVNGRRLNPQAREAVSEDATVTLGSLTLTAGVIEQARRGRLMRPRDTDRLLIGRALFTDLRLDAPTVSDQHAELRREGGEWFLRDLNSAAGTWVNGRLARGWIRLHQGDRVELGRFRLALDSLGAGSPTFTALDYGRELRLELRGVGVCAPNGAVLLNDVQLAARPGELVMVLGPSGAGKSTLLRLLAGLSRPNTGRVTINGQDLQGRGGFFASLIGWVPQQETLPEGLTAAEVLRFAARLRLPPEAVEERVAAVLDSLELGPVAGVRVNSGLSGGQLRRLSIGVELLSDPGLLVLDEPCAGLDSRASLNVLRLCRRLADSGRPVVLSAHAPRPEALELADLAVVLAEGRLVWAGPPGGAMRAFFTPAGRRPHPQATAADLAMDSLAPQDGAEQAEVWAARFATTETYARYVAARLGPGEPSPSPSPAEPPRPTPARAFVQYVTLCRRSALQLTRSPADLALLAAQAPSGRRPDRRPVSPAGLLVDRGLRRGARRPGSAQPRLVSVGGGGDVAGQQQRGARARAGAGELSAGASGGAVRGRGDLRQSDGARPRLGRSGPRVDPRRGGLGPADPHRSAPARGDLGGAHAHRLVRGEPGPAHLRRRAQPLRRGAHGAPRRAAPDHARRPRRLVAVAGAPRPRRRGHDRPPPIVF
jgi:ABC-type multidrug transport system ATPase subunit/pSer/pThr/pTyr-binding forkhead associated (FHA) protein